MGNCHWKGAATMLIGEYHYSIDEKGRLNFPAKFREQMGERFIVTRWLEECLIAFPMPEWQRVFDALNQSGLVAGRTARRFLLAAAEEVTVDKQGRILIPQPLREHAKLKKDVTLIGADPYVEIWDAAAWEKECACMSPQEIAKAMETLGI